MLPNKKISLYYSSSVLFWVNYFIPTTLQEPVAPEKEPKGEKKKRKRNASCYSWENYVAYVLSWQPRWYCIMLL